ncbi:CDP-diacylglycerol--glycerol-3-phosphate 3-phosphatidyltransferase [Thiotrichales bacterium 19S11-10]|nr:CDP-diacylglycerol--glycerol-3-phosphate 3-phosphatidyltransferase [Thiotrichales bacterium 19S11-10]MCF6807431.1 CDP-diacylglycerol--glycerol-3-phosphate 3-phosphatidyltransferase [Thiotrichales bacterium 19S9-11]MCF6811400.1 CDP-diacylglycerol--glycerol-3-phosphate 3-phosphatidyltransferase [Thiotrichales bacterium 19S9-12]
MKVVRLMWTIPNILTILRIVLVPVFVAIFYFEFEGAQWVAAVLFLVASLTDWLDGFIARYFKQTTQLGAFLDPVADKLMVAAALVLIVNVYPSAWVAIPAAAIIVREIVVSALREWMAELGKRAVVQVSFIGKVKTATQMIAIFILLLYHYQQVDYFWQILLGKILLYVAVVLTIYSMWLYLRAAYLSFKSSNE